MSLFNRRIPTIRGNERFSATPNSKRVVEESLEEIEETLQEESIEIDVIETKTEEPLEEPETIEEETKVSLGTIIVYHMTDGNEELDSEIFTDLEIGSHVVKAKNFDEYKRAGNRQKTLKISEDNLDIEYTFYYNKE